MKPIVFGNVARYFGKKREDDGHTHQWTVYVKPYRNEVDTLCRFIGILSAVYEWETSLTKCSFSFPLDIPRICLLM